MSEPHKRYAKKSLAQTEPMSMEKAQRIANTLAREVDNFCRDDQESAAAVRNAFNEGMMAGDGMVVLVQWLCHRLADAEEEIEILRAERAAQDIANIPGGL